MPFKPYEKEGTVETIVDNGLCTQCGFCEPVCPTGAINIEVNSRTGELLPVVSQQDCVMCPLCLRVCPGETFDFDKYYREYFGVSDYEQHLGHICNVYLAYSCNTEHRYRSSSGGALTELAAYALVKDFVDYIILARPKINNPFSAESIITDSPDEVRASSGSIYYPVALGDQLGELLKSVSPESKLGLIGLPCHIQAAHNLLKTPRYIKYNWELIFGLFCGGTWTYKATDEFLKHQHEEMVKIREFHFRGEGWPGSINWKRIDGKCRTFERKTETFTKKLFKSVTYSAYSSLTPHRCFTCSDGLAELADISFGDPWLKSQKEDSLGKTILITRSNIAKILLETSTADQIISVEASSKQELLVSQKRMITFKHNYPAFNFAVRLLSPNKKTPNYNYKWKEKTRTPIIIYLYAVTSYLHYKFCNTFQQNWLRVFFVLIQSSLNKAVKRLVKLTDDDSNNYFS